MLVGKEVVLKVQVEGIKPRSFKCHQRKKEIYEKEEQSKAQTCDYTYTRLLTNPQTALHTYHSLHQQRHQLSQLRCPSRSSNKYFKCPIPYLHQSSQKKDTHPINVYGT